MVTCTKYFHVYLFGASCAVLFRGEYFDILDGEVLFWVGDLLLGSCDTSEISKITYYSEGCLRIVDDFDEEGRFGDES